MYKPLVLFNLLTDLYPGTPICCNTTYASILLHDTTQPLVPDLPEWRYGSIATENAYDYAADYATDYAHWFLIN